MLGAFTDQAHNLILLAGDEARMLGRLVVEPEHLLLALSRRGTVRSLFAERDVTGSDVYASIVGRSGVGDDLVLGALPRSRATDRVLELHAGCLVPAASICSLRSPQTRGLRRQRSWTISGSMPWRSLMRCRENGASR